MIPENCQQDEREAPKHGHDKTAIAKGFSTVQAQEEGLIGISLSFEECAGAGVHDHFAVFTTFGFTKEKGDGGRLAFELPNNFVDWSAGGLGGHTGLCLSEARLEVGL